MTDAYDGPDPYDPDISDEDLEVYLAEHSDYYDPWDDPDWLPPCDCWCDTCGCHGWCIDDNDEMDDDESDY